MQSLKPEGPTLDQFLESASVPLHQTDSVPPWLDKDKFRKGQAFFKRCTLSVLLCEMFGGFKFSLCPTVFKVLVYYTKYELVDRAVSVYASVMSHFQTWYDGDVWDPDSEAGQSIRRVHRKHMKLGNNCNRFKPSVDAVQMDITREETVKCELFDKFDEHQSSFQYPPQFPKDRPYMTQLDISVTAVSFIYPIVVCPDKVGVHGVTEEDITGFLHIWRTFIYLLGVDDQYNPFTGTLDDVRKLTQDYMQQVFLPNFKSLNSDQEFFGRIMLKSGQRISWLYRIFSVSPCGIALYIAWYSGVPEAYQAVYRNVAWYDVLHLWALQFVFYLSFRVPIFRALGNYMGRTSIKHAKAFHARDKEARKLKA